MERTATYTNFILVFSSRSSSRYGWGLAEPIPDLGPSFLYSANLFKAIFSGELHPNKYSYGAASVRSKIQLIGPAVDDGIFRWLQYSINPLGDAQLELLTDDPVAIDLLSPNAIPLGNDDPVIIKTGTAMSRICITDGEVVVLDEILVSSGGDEHVEHCDVVSVSASLKNIGSDTSYNTRLSYLCDDENVIFIEDVTTAFDLAPGQSLTIDSAIVFEIGCYVPDNYHVNFTTKISSDNWEREDKYHISVAAPDLVVENIFTKEN